jgi:Tripartite tricarboxylate transporter TctB family
MAINTKDVLAAAIFVAIGAFFFSGALIDLRIGTALSMGPGYFPMMVGGLLMAFGAAIGLLAVGSTPSPYGPVSWRGIILITLAPIVFGLTVRGLGLVPSIALTIGISAFASSRMKISTALMLCASLTIFCVLVFNIGLGLPLRLFGPWLPI